jgi:hypothetical protein
MTTSFSRPLKPETMDEAADEGSIGAREGFSWVLKMVILRV